MQQEVENNSEIKPSELDKESSPGNVIIRKNFEQVPTFDEEGLEIGYHWRFLEEYIPKETYDRQDMIESNRADIAYISMMADIEL